MCISVYSDDGGLEPWIFMTFHIFWAYSSSQHFWGVNGQPPTSDNLTVIPWSSSYIYVYIP